ncbi:MAG TPA: hypothetical protein VGL81_35555 [Polyangiaceae bacterium]|jgi:hypothetical protein
MGSRLLPTAFIVATALAVLAAAPVARAQSTDPVAAQALFDTAKRLMNERKYAEACPKLEESQRLDPAIGTHYAMAECYEKAGRLASAWVAYLDVASEAGAQKRADREQYAKARAAALAPRLSRITVVVPPASRTAGLEIKRDGETLHEAQWGLSVPTDPGSHVIAATAPGKLPFQTTVVVHDEGKVQEVQLPPLADAPAPPPAPVGPVTPAPAPEAAPVVAEGPHGLGTQRMLAIAAGAVGLGGVVVGSIFGLESLSKHSSSQQQCQGNACTPAGLQDVSDGKSAGNVSTIAFIAGGAAIAGGVVLWLTAPSGSPTVGALGVAPLVGVGSAGFSLRGAW